MPWQFNQPRRAVAARHQRSHNVQITASGHAEPGTNADRAPATRGEWGRAGECAGTVEEKSSCNNSLHSDDSKSRRVRALASCPELPCQKVLTGWRPDGTSVAQACSPSKAYFKLKSLNGGHVGSSRATGTGVSMFYSAVGRGLFNCSKVGKNLGSSQSLHQGHGPQSNSRSLNRVPFKSVRVHIFVENRMNPPRDPLFSRSGQTTSFRRSKRTQGCRCFGCSSP